MKHLVASLPPGSLLPSASPTGPGPMKHLLFSVLLTCIIGWIDYATGLELRVFPLYLVPVGIGSWFIGRSAGFGISLLCMGAWELAAHALGGATTGNWVEAWNFVVQLAALIAFATLFSRLRQQMDRERSMSRMDPVTELPNTRAFYEQAEREIARVKRHRRSLTVACLDLDHFKDVNDQFGHQVGDEVLRSIASTLRKSCRESDFVARVGGDEFILLLPESDERQASALLERIRSHVSSQMELGGWGVTTSIGAISTVLFSPGKAGNRRLA